MPARRLIWGRRWEIAVAVIPEVIPGLDLFPTWTLFVGYLIAAPFTVRTAPASMRSGIAGLAINGDPEAMRDLYAAAAQRWADDGLPRHEAYVPDLASLSVGLTQSSFATRGLGTRLNLTGNVDIPVP